MTAATVNQDVLRPEPASDPDSIYQTLVDGYDGLDAEQSRAMTTRLVLLLANHIGDPAVIAQAVAAARAALAGDSSAADLGGKTF